MEINCHVLDDGVEQMILALVDHTMATKFAHTKTEKFSRITVLHEGSDRALNGIGQLGFHDLVLAGTTNSSVDFAALVVDTMVSMIVEIGTNGFRKLVHETHVIHVVNILSIKSEDLMLGGLR